MAADLVQNLDPSLTKTNSSNKIINLHVIKLDSSLYIYIYIARCFASFIENVSLIEC